MRSAVPPMPMAALVDLVNGWGHVPRREAEEQDRPYPPAAGLAHRLATSEDAVPSDDALCAVADLLHPVFATDDQHEQASLVNRLLDATAVRPTLTHHPGGLAQSWSVEDPDNTLLAAAAIALRQQLTTHPGHRIGTCEGRRCADAYVDTSPTGQRRFCSVRCQNRTRAASHRQRHRP